MQIMILSLAQCNLIVLGYVVRHNVMKNLKASLLLILCSVNDIRLSLSIDLKETENKSIIMNKSIMCGYVDVL